MYKLVHQASLGAVQMVIDPLSARNYLERELAEMGEGQTEPTFDPISPEEEIVRVHLRPYLANGSGTEALLAAFLTLQINIMGKLICLKQI